MPPGSVALAVKVTLCPVAAGEAPLLTEVTTGVEIAAVTVLVLVALKALLFDAVTVTL
jgi:hypothetical protein